MQCLINIRTLVSDENIHILCQQLILQVLLLCARAIDTSNWMTLQPSIFTWEKHVTSFMLIAKVHTNPI